MPEPILGGGDQLGRVSRITKSANERVGDDTVPTLHKRHIRGHNNNAHQLLPVAEKRHIGGKLKLKSNTLGS